MASRPTPSTGFFEMMGISEEEPSSDSIRLDKSIDKQTEDIEASEFLNSEASIVC